MSKQLDYNNLSDDDKAWLRSRGWGYRIPGEVQTSKDTGVVLDANASLEEQLAATPNTGTATVSAGTMPTEDQYTKDDYESWKVADLKDEIDSRNTDRDESDLIDKGDGKKATLVAALVADDQRDNA